MIVHPGTATNQLFNSTSTESGSYLAVAETGVLGRFRVTVLNAAGTIQADYFTFSNPADGVTYAVWMDKDAAGTEPTGASYVAATNKLKASYATGNSAAQVGAAVATALAGQSAWLTVTDNSNGTVDLINKKMGTNNVPVAKAADGIATSSIVLSLIVAGVASNNLNTYFTLGASTGNKYFIWFNVHSEGSAPTVTGYTAEAVLVAIGDSAATIAATIKTKLDTLSKWATSRTNATLTIVDNASGQAEDIINYTSVGTVAVLTEGNTAPPNGATAVDSLTNVTTIIGDLR